MARRNETSKRANMFSNVGNTVKPKVNTTPEKVENRPIETISQSEHKEVQEMPPEAPNRQNKPILGRKPTIDPRDREKGYYTEEMPKTRGVKGSALKRANLGLSKLNHDWLEEEAAIRGIIVNQLINDCVGEFRTKHGETPKFKHTEDIDHNSEGRPWYCKSSIGYSDPNYNYLTVVSRKARVSSTQMLNNIIGEYRLSYPH